MIGHFFPSYCSKTYKYYVNNNNNNTNKSVSNKDIYIKTLQANKYI